jgi:cytochrome c oxidase subunit 2
MLFVKYVEYAIERVLRKRTHGNVRELLWTILPTFLLLIISVPSLELLYLADGFGVTEGPVLTYKVVGHQWYWTYEYVGLFGESLSFDSYMISKEDLYAMAGLRLLEVDNPLFVPTYTNLQFLITSTDVLHSWAVPALGIKVDAIPGRLSQVSTMVNRDGTFYGQCSEICGINHGFMPIKIIAVDNFGEESI